MDPAPTNESAPRVPPELPRRAYPLFLGGMASWFVGWGMQTVMFQWLVVEQLRESAVRVGTAQMALLLPSLAFILIGGALADRVDRRRALTLLHALAAALSLGLASVVASGAFSYRVLIGYALLAGSVQAFVIPIRDAQLSDVVRGGMSRAVAGLMTVQHGGQGLGALAAGLATLLGGPWVLALQSLVQLAGSGVQRGLPRLPRPPREEREPVHVRELRTGIVEVWRSPVLRAVMLLNVSVGMVFVGTYLVLLPLLVRELYGGGAERMGLLVAMLPVGSIAVNLGIVARGGVSRQGRALVLGQGFAGLSLAGLAIAPPFWGAALAVAAWGVGAAFAINASRTLFQEHAPEASRGRVLSIYSLSVLGTGPLGALVTGVLAGEIGTLPTLYLYSFSMTLLMAGTWFTSVRRFE